MRIFYQGTEITGDVRVKEATVLDYAGGRSDRVELAFDDPAQNWARWGPAKGDVLRLTEGAYRTGDMYVDEIRQRNGTFHLGAVSVPPALRDSGERTWGNIRFSALVAEFAARAGMAHRVYGMPGDPLYRQLRQEGQSDIEWLANQCLLESCMLKVTAGMLVAYYEPWLERRDEAAQISLLEGTGYELRRISAHIYAGCRVESVYTGTHLLADGRGPLLRAQEADFSFSPVSGQGEAERYAKGILRAYNKREFQADCNNLPLLPHLAAGSLVTVTTAGIAFPGRWVVEKARHQLVTQKTTLKLRKPLEGY